MAFSISISALSMAIYLSSVMYMTYLVIGGGALLIGLISLITIFVKHGRPQDVLKVKDKLTLLPHQTLDDFDEFQRLLSFMPACHVKFADNELNNYFMYDDYQY